LIIIALAAIATVLYARTIGYGFVWDDDAVVLKDPRALSLKESLRAFREPVDRLYRPVRTMSYAIDAMFSGAGQSPLPYHVDNVFLYALTAAAFYLFLYALTGRITYAVGGAALYAVHPIHVEPVAWISGGRADLLAAPALFFSFALLLITVRSSKRFYTTLAAGLLLYFIALLSKESAVAGFVILILCFILFPPEDSIGYFRRSFIVSVAVIFITAVYLIVRSTSAPVAGQALTPHGDSLFARIAAVAPALPDYIRLAILPLKQCAVYTLAEPFPPYWHALVYIGVVTAALATAAILVRKKAPVLTLSVALWILMLAPVMNIFALIQLKAERFLFLPSAAWCMVAACVFLVRRPILRFHLVAAFLLLFAVYAGIAWQRTPVFRSEHTLWTDTASCAPNSYLAQFNFGNDCFRRSDYKRAAAAYKRTIELKHGYFPAYERLADSYALMGDYNKAIDLLEQNLKIAPLYPKAMIKLGFAYARTGQHNAAVHWFERAYSINRNPDLLKAAERERRISEINH
jgi:protein O-mannosyl-transferase